MTTGESAPDRCWENSSIVSSGTSQNRVYDEDGTLSQTTSTAAGHKLKRIGLRQTQDSQQPEVFVR